MKPPSYRKVRQTIRLKPGRMICMPPRFLKHAGWRVGDVLLVSVEGGHVSIARLPEENTWRIDRLRQRTGSTAQVAAANRMIRTYGDYRALQRQRGKTESGLQSSRGGKFL